jgi:hypothetical protein
MAATLRPDYLLQYFVLSPSSIFASACRVFSNAVLSVRTDINPPSANVNVITLLCPYLYHLFHLLLFMPLPSSNVNLGDGVRHENGHSAILGYDYGSDIARTSSSKLVWLSRALVLGEPAGLFRNLTWLGFPFWR